MIKKYKLSLILGSVVTLLPMAIGLILWDRLPDTIPIHWGISGNADAVAGPWVVVLLLPLLLLAMQWFCVWITFRDPRTREQNPKALQLALWCVPISSIFSSSIIYVGALGNGLSLFRLIPILIGTLFIIVGNYMPKITPNSHLGIKTPWTFHSEENWRATHRFCGKLWVICGFVAFLGTFLPEKRFPLAMLIPLVLLVIPSFLYPYLYYRKQVKEGLPPIPKKPLTKTRVLGMIALILAVIFAIFALVYTLFTGDIRYQWNETSFTIEADFWTDLTVEYDAITSVEYLEEADHGTRSSGFGSPRLSIGSFRSEEYGNFTLYAYTQCPSAVLIRSGDRILMINGETPENTAELYNYLKEELK